MALASADAESLITNNRCLNLAAFGVGNVITCIPRCRPVAEMHLKPQRDLTNPEVSHRENRTASTNILLCTTRLGSLFSLLKVGHLETRAEFHKVSIRSQVAHRIDFFSDNLSS